MSSHCALIIIMTATVLHKNETSEKKQHILEYMLS